jgi:hypothetical protein
MSPAQDPEHAANGDQSLVDLERYPEGERRPLRPATLKPYNAQEHLDKTAAWLAGALVGILAATVVFSFGVVATHPDRAQAIHDLLGIVFTPLVALVGSAVGYYFAARKNNGV